MYWEAGFVDYKKWDEVDAKFREGEKANNRGWLPHNPSFLRLVLRLVLAWEL